MVEPRCIRYNSHTVDYDSVFRTYYNPTVAMARHVGDWQEQARPSAATPATSTGTATANRNRNRNRNRNQQTHISILAFRQQLCESPLCKSISPSIPILIMHV